MLDETIIEKLTERIVGRIENTNAYILEEIGKTIKHIGGLTPSKARQLVQILKYGGSYKKIAQKIAEITGINIKEIYEMFEEIAKQDYIFAKQFYDYRNVDYIPYEQNLPLQNMVRSIANDTVKNYLNISNTLGFARTDKRGNPIFTELSKMYQDIIDESVLAVQQGKDTFQNQMYKTIKELGNSGIKTIDYKSGYKRRVDSAVRMNIKDGIRNVSNKIQEELGKEFRADGIEITVHINPADDHEDVQGKQFSKEEFEKFQEGLTATDYEGKTYTPVIHNKNRRPISAMNCYHRFFSIVLGISKPIYSKEQLKEIEKNNQLGFEFEGKHYSMYEGTQIQRKLETEIRKTKEMQILARASGNEQLILESQTKIRQLTNKYNSLSKESGLLTKVERLKVDKYKRVNTSRFHLKDVVRAPDTILQNMVNYGKMNEIIPKGTTLENVRVIAGYGTNKKIKTIDKLMRDFPDLSPIWQKKVGTINSKYNSYEIHFYENSGKQYYLKLKSKKEKK